LQVARERFKDGEGRKTTGKFSMHKIAPVWKWLFIVVLAIIAIAAAFHFDGAVRSWVVEHSNRTAKQFMRNVSRYGDWPEHVLAGLLIVAIAYWRGRQRLVRIGLTMILACALAGTAARGVKIATGPPSNKNSDGTVLASARNTIRSRAATPPRRRRFSASSFSQIGASRFACYRFRCSSPRRACMSRRTIYRMWSVRLRWGSSARGSSADGSFSKKRTLQRLKIADVG
jgi:hypothetical protein